MTCADAGGCHRALADLVLDVYLAVSVLADDGRILERNIVVFGLTLQGIQDLFRLIRRIETDYN